MSIDRLLEMPANQYQVVDVIALRDAFHDKVETIVSLREQLSDAQSRVAELEARIEQAQKQEPVAWRSHDHEGDWMYHEGSCPDWLAKYHPEAQALYAAPVPPAEAKVAVVPPHIIGALHRARDAFIAHANRITAADPLDYDAMFPAGDAESITELLAMLAAKAKGDGT